jgi:hypothetical protein
MRPATIFVLLFSTVLAYPLCGQDNAAPPLATRQADNSLRRFELGVSVADIRTGCIGTPYPCHIPSFGLGLGGAMNLNRYFAFDANVNVTPGIGPSTGIAGGHATEILIGVRAEVRAKHYGYFLDAQPGILNWNQAITKVVTVNPLNLSLSGVNRFVSDVGAGFEYSPTARIHVRGEVADLVMRNGQYSWTNNLQPSAGVYVGLGKAIDWTPPAYDAKKSHRFFDRGNVVLITGSALGATADGITTQRFIAHGVGEGDPFARPLVKYGWSGQISIEALEMGGEILGMYGLHRIGKHWIERLIPVCDATTHGILAYKNDRVLHKSGTTTPLVSDRVILFLPP